MTMPKGYVNGDAPIGRIDHTKCRHQRTPQKNAACRARKIEKALAKQEAQAETITYDPQDAAEVEVQQDDEVVDYEKDNGPITLSRLAAASVHVHALTNALEPLEDWAMTCLKPTEHITVVIHGEDPEKKPFALTWDHDTQGLVVTDGVHLV